MKLMKVVEERVLAHHKRAGEYGIHIDEEIRELQIVLIESEMEKLQAEADEFVGYPIKLTSRKQVAVFLFDELLFDATPKRSVSKAALVGFDHPFITAYQRYLNRSRALSLIKKTKLFQAVGRLTSQWKSSENNGRLYAKDFNVQQLTVDGRRFLVPDPGCKFVLVDMAQYELRCLALISQCAGLRSLLEGEDLHVSVMSKLLKKHPNEISSDEREMGKILNYGLMYGMSAESFAKKFQISLKQAEIYKAQYFGLIPGVLAYRVKIIEQACKTGKVVNPLGFCRYLPYTPDDPEGFERRVFQTMVSSMAASLFKLQCYKLVKPNLSYPLNLVLTVHDSMLIQIPEQALTQELESLLTLSVLGINFPFTISRGGSWAETHENKS